MTPTPERRFTLLDAMVLIAATAAALTFIRATGLSFLEPTFDHPRAKYAALARHEASMAMPFLTSWTLAFFGLRLIPPRPRLRRLGRQPGTAACIAAILAVAIHSMWLLSVFIGVVDPVGKGWLRVPRFFFESFGDVAPYAIIGAWSTYALSARRRPRTDWVDRFGNILGVAWIVAVLARSVALLGILSI
ncbi:MAG: hypothetical protein BGO49_23340 [Planctomycetales bacterium 71-10]|nr:MAG: hypothetical protein BGO49_23340 [Planctomycetales bacterium 71-10]